MKLLRPISVALSIFCLIILLMVVIGLLTNSYQIIWNQKDGNDYYGKYTNVPIHRAQSCVTSGIRLKYPFEYFWTIYEKCEG